MKSPEPGGQTDSATPADEEGAGRGASKLERDGGATETVDRDSAGVYFMSVEDFERRRPPSPRPQHEREGAES